MFENWWFSFWMDLKRDPNMLLRCNLILKKLLAVATDQNFWNSRKAIWSCWMSQREIISWHPAGLVEQIAPQLRSVFKLSRFLIGWYSQQIGINLKTVVRLVIFQLIAFGCCPRLQNHIQMLSVSSNFLDLNLNLWHLERPHRRMLIWTKKWKIFIT